MPSTPLADKTTISSRNKISHLNGVQDILATHNKIRTLMPPPPPSQIARNSALRNGFANFTMKNGRSSPTPSSTSSSHSTTTISKTSNHTPLPSSTTARPTARTISSKSNATMRKMGPLNNAQIQPNGLSRTNGHSLATRLPLHTTGKIGRKETASSGGAIPPSTQSRILAPQSRLSQTTNAQLNSRSSSTMSTLSSLTTTSKKPSVNTLVECKDSATQNIIPSAVTTRKGLAKFSNPIECQRQFQILSLKIRQATEVIEDREKEIDKLQEQLKYAKDIGVVYATTVQYFADKLKLDCKVNLETECEQLKMRVDQLMVNETEYENKLSDIVDDYKNHLQVELDLRNNIEKELEQTRASNLKELETLKEAHQNELDDLIEKHSNYARELQDKIESLESELETKSRDLLDLRKDHEVLNNNYNKLEESLTKDKDARVKYAQEKITQLQKDVDSLNSVLEMRLERIHALEKDSLHLVEIQNELVSQKDLNKAINQQLESVNAALEKRREQYESLVAEHEQLRQELTRERKERRRMTMKTEQLEYVLNESCATESNIVFNSSVRDIDSADHLV